MTLTARAVSLRTPARWLREVGGARPDEDWALVLLGVVLLVATLGLAGLAAGTVHEHDVALQNATAAGQRLDVGGLDNQLYQDLVDMQQDEIALFGLRQEPSQAPRGHDPATDLTRVESDLTVLKARFRGSPPVQRDISLITWELPYFTSLGASALDYNQQEENGDGTNINIVAVTSERHRYRTTNPYDEARYAAAEHVRHPRREETPDDPKNANPDHQKRRLSRSDLQHHDK